MSSFFISIKPEIMTTSVNTRINEDNCFDYSRWLSDLVVSQAGCSKLETYVLIEADVVVDSVKCKPFVLNTLVVFFARCHSSSV